MTSGNAAGMNVDALAVELPAAATYVTPAATDLQIASRKPPSEQWPTGPTSPRLMLAICTSLPASPSSINPVRWSMPQMTFDHAPEPESPSTLIGTSRDLC